MCDDEYIELFKYYYYEYYYKHYQKELQKQRYLQIVLYEKIENLKKERLFHRVLSRSRAYDKTNKNFKNYH